MIEPKDVKIGNRLFNGTVVSVEENDVLIHDGYALWRQSKMPGGFDPIPLDEFWILELGFKRLGNRKMWVKGNVCVVLMDYNDISRKTEGEVFFIGFKDMGNAVYHTQFELPYVHNLQNGYALTGKELIIEE